MRILDKNTDYYDYLQNVYPDDSVVFDRTDSYILHKKDLCEYMYVFRQDNRLTKYYEYDIDQANFLLLQIGCTYWLFLAVLSGISDTSRYFPGDYTLELLKMWKNYDKPRTLIGLSVIKFNYGLCEKFSASGWSWRSGFIREKLYACIDDMVKAVNNKDYDVHRTVKSGSVMVGETRYVKHIPILKACGIAECVDPTDVYWAFDEYFSLQKQDAERTDAIGTTNTAKIKNHGFDVKTSFRGKAK